MRVPIRNHGYDVSSMNVIRSHTCKMPNIIPTLTGYELCKGGNINGGWKVVQRNPSCPKMGIDFVSSRWGLIWVCPTEIIRTLYPFSGQLWFLWPHSTDFIQSVKTSDMAHRSLPQISDFWSENLAKYILEYSPTGGASWMHRTCENPMTSQEP